MDLNRVVDRAGADASGGWWRRTSRSVTRLARGPATACTADRSQLEQVSSTSWSTRATRCPTAARSLIETRTSSSTDLPRRIRARPGRTSSCGDRHRLRHGRRDPGARSSSRSSRPRRSARAPASASRRCTASSSRAAATSGSYSEVGRGTSFKISLPRGRRRRARGWIVPRPSAGPIEGRTRCHDPGRRGRCRSAERRLPAARAARVWRRGVVQRRRRAGDALAESDSDGGSGHLRHRDAGDERSGAPATSLRELRPDLPVLLMSGYSEEAITRLGNHGSLGPMIEKPFTVDGMLETTSGASCMDETGSRREHPDRGR